MVRPAEALPALPVVIDHIAKPRIGDRQFDDWAELMDTMARFPNVLCRLCGLVTETQFHRWQTSYFTPYVDMVLDAFGAGRAMCGSDWPVCLLSADSYAQQLNVLHDCLSGLSDADRARVLGENAARFYGLERKT